MEVVVVVFFWLFGLTILYRIIQAAVRSGGVVEVQNDLLESVKAIERKLDAINGRNIQ